MDIAAAFWWGDKSELIANKPAKICYRILNCNGNDKNIHVKTNGNIMNTPFTIVKPLSDTA